MRPTQIRTSSTFPLRIDEISPDWLPGPLGLTLCPGKWDQNGDIVWNRDLALDLQAIKDWGAAVVVTLMEEFEFSMLRVETLPELTRALGMEWLHLPIRDGGIPTPEFDARWKQVGSNLRSRLRNGQRILIHCRGGMGRTGVVAARILVEEGMQPERALLLVRATRSGAIEEGLQEHYVLHGLTSSMELPQDRQACS